MSKIRHILSVIHYTICGAVCFQFTHFPCDVWIYILCLIIIIKSEVWTITHCLGLGHETMVCTVCLSVFLSKYPLKPRDSLIPLLSSLVAPKVMVIKRTSSAANDDKVGTMSSLGFNCFCAASADVLDILSNCIFYGLRQVLVPPVPARLPSRIVMLYNN